MPLRRLLVYMELSGMPFDQGLATQLWNRVRETMDSLEDQIYMKARKRFSLSSRKDLKKVKESLNIKAGDTEHPFIVNIHNWRKLSSLKSRNLSPLLMTHLKDGRCRGQSCSFTVTGRIVMHNPNLQHIPRDFTVNNELFSLRSAFVAKPGNVILSADYCQLELRILAHFSQDPDLLSSIHNEADVFVSIAAKWNNISPDKVTDDIRHQTKQIIYGIIYGMGDRALGDALGIDPPEAALLAAKFRRSYPGVQRFMDACIADCRRKGYVTTLTGRVRRLKGISSSSPSVRAQAERQAVNSTIQGSAADIAKSATLRVESKLAESIENRGHVLTPLSASHLILHLHDELIYEVSNDYVEAVKETLKTEMAGAVQLKVALPVVVKCGPSWGQMKKI
ncbi:DNA polymerase theta [Nesidiocoris tenuis]|uniref:DNA polymerase theta n=1 Tax=Nesidiocoris tenuis TaxID=355587 RepID=A0ABN7A785_9HEMI|nr:DNA polymerase theta [Nesidiocoris tenuis]